MSEFLLSLLLSIIAVTATSGLLRTQWERTRCAYLTFEAVHARLVGAAVKPDLRIQLEESPAQVSGVGRCGQAREQVALPRLEEEGSP